MKRLIWLGLVMVSLLAACTAPPAMPVTPAGGQTAASASLPEVTVFRSPT